MTNDSSTSNTNENLIYVEYGTIHYYLWGDALKTCAQNEYHAPVCDLYRELGVNGVNYTWFSTDGVHPNKDGLIRMGNHIASALISKF